MSEYDEHGPNAEHVHMLMAVVAGDIDEPLCTMDESGSGVVEYSVPAGDHKGCSANFLPSVSGHDYVIAAWGDGSFYTFNLAEKVWMSLGLTPRCVGNEHQRVVYDDLRLPEFNVAEGEISSEYEWTLKRNVSWRMSNEYLRKYLWLRNAQGVRAFFYEAQLPDHRELRGLMKGERHIELRPEQGPSWFTLDIRENNGGLLLQVWASVVAVKSELCPGQSSDGVVWPDVPEPVTGARANAMMAGPYIYLKDSFLEKYEQSSFYEAIPVQIHGAWFCSPSYKGQWSFTECMRVGRNLVRVPIRELYKPKPDREILHARNFALAQAEYAHFDVHEEHITAKVQRLLDQLLRLGDNLSALGLSVGIQKRPDELVGFSRGQLHAEGWRAYPALCRLAQVAPLEMTQQTFLSRCKSIHEIWQRIPNGFLRELLAKAGCPNDEVNKLGSMKLIESLLNIFEHLNGQQERLDAFATRDARDGWRERNEGCAALFLTNDLRIADAHETFRDCIQTLQTLGFDTAHLNQGYGKALDFVMDGVSECFGKLNGEIENLLSR